VINLQAPKISSFYAQSLAIFLIRFFPALGSLGVIILLAHKLPMAQYGQYSQFMISVNLMCPLACFGVQALTLQLPKSKIFRFVGQLPQKNIGLFAANMLFWSLVFGFVLNYTLGRSAGLTTVYLVCYAATLILESVLLALQQQKVLLWSSLLFTLITVLAHVLFLYLSFDLSLFLWSLIGVYGLKLLLYAAVIRRQKSNDESQDGQVSTQQDLLRLWAHLGVYDAIQVGSTWVDKFAVSILLSATWSGIYYNGTFTIPFLPIVLGAVSGSAIMHLARLSPEQHEVEVGRISHKVARTLSAIVFPLAAFLLCYSGEFIGFVFNDNYSLSVPIFFVSCLVLPVRAYSFTAILQSLHRGDVINKGGIMELIIALLLLYPGYLIAGLPGMAASFVISTYFQVFYYLYHLTKILKLPVGALLPLPHLAIKASLFAFIMFGVHFLTTLYFSANIALFLGSIVLVLGSSIAIVFEMKKEEKYGIQ